jgi:4-hydroxy-4-methyl-2-oxoglutarate aldolase
MLMTPISQITLDALKELDTCTVSNAIERFQTRLRNEGYSNSSLRCCFPRLPPIVGFAVTLRLRGSNPPMEGGAYVDDTAWWDEFASQPVPRVAVIEDGDRQPGTGAFIGETHAAILQALGCVGALTNGAVRDLDDIERLGFPLFAGSVSVSHAYAHVVKAESTVNISGLKIDPGDLLHGDQHGVVKIPIEFATDIPAMAERLQKQDRKIIEFCRSGDFSREGLREMLRKSP